VSEAVAHLSPRHALRLVATSPGGKAKTARDLRHEAQRFTEDAERRDRLAISSLAHTGNRRTARQLAKARKAAESRANAKVVAMAAAEVGRRKARTVGDALRNPVVRFLRKLGGRRG
jgi:hypothetical protein